MRTMVHLSDLHFGAADPAVVEAVAGCVNELGPHIVAVSGDLTQRARRNQFRRARAFLSRLPQPQVVVPGNHDVPLYNVLARFGAPLRGFRRHITADPQPSYMDDEVVVIGANTTRSFTISHGGLRHADVDRVAEVLDRAPLDAVRIIVCHHPFDLPPGRSGRWTSPPPAPDAVNTLVARGADVFLTGHLHLNYVGHTATRYQVAGRAAIVVEAGTATSVRLRGETNSFNVLRIDTAEIAVERMDWDPSTQRFVMARREAFARDGGGWMPKTA
jgi:3',5'-cyclic AMP phosphodiesterase CpdA